MNINTKTKNISLTLEEEKLIYNKLYFALYANEKSIAAVEVSVCAIPGFKLEWLHHCRIEIQLLNGNTVIGDSCKSDVNVAIDRAIDRSCSKVSSSIDSQLRLYSLARSRLARGNRQGSAKFQYETV